MFGKDNYQIQKNAYDTKEDTVFYEDLNVYENLDRVMDNNLLYSPKEKTMVNFNPFNPFLEVQNLANNVYEYNNITGNHDNEKEMHDIELETAINNTISNITNNITVILNTGIWKYIDQFIYPEYAYRVYELFQGLNRRIENSTSSLVRSVRRKFYDNPDSTRIISIMTPEICLSVNEISFVYNHFINDCINFGYINIRKTNNVADQCYLGIADKYNIEIAPKNNTEYTDYDPSFIIAMLNGQASQDICKISEILEMNIVYFYNRLCTLKKLNHLPESKAHYKYLNEYE